MYRRRYSSSSPFQANQSTSVKLARHFDSVAELFDYVETALPSGAFAHEQQSETGTLDFTGTASLAAALELARYGWPEGAAMVKALSARLSETVAQSVTVPALTWDVSGECPDVGAYLSGTPEHMARWEEAEAGHRVVRVVCSVSATGNISPETMKTRGAVACALVDAIERSGARAEVTAVACNDGKIAYTVTVKRAEEPLNMDRLAFCLAHPSMLRRIMFKVRECCPTWARIIGGSYAKSCDVPDNMRGDVYVGVPAYGDYGSPAAAELTFKRMIAAAGVKLTKE